MCPVLTPACLVPRSQEYESSSSIEAGLTSNKSTQTGPEAESEVQEEAEYSSDIDVIEEKASNVSKEAISQPETSTSSKKKAIGDSLRKVLSSDLLRDFFQEREEEKAMKESGLPAPGF